MQVLSVGEVLWDVFQDRELLGGAPLNFSANTVRLGNAAALITGIGDDERGRLAQDAMTALGVSTEFVRVKTGEPTGMALVSTGPEGEPRFEIPRPAAFDVVEMSAEALERAKLLKPDWLYFGTLIHADEHVEQMTKGLSAWLPGVRCFYDMNLRPGSWNLLLVQRLCEMASILKLNEFEARTLGDLTGMGAEPFTLEEFCREWALQYGIDGICVTLGAAGCLVYQNGAAHTVPGYPATVKDTVGAGDAFAAAFLHGYHHGWPVLQSARFANALGSIVASRPGATPDWTLQECLELAAIPWAQAATGDVGRRS